MENEKETILKNLGGEFERITTEISDKETEIEDKNTEIENNEDFELNEDDFDEFLDEIYPTSQIGSMEFYASDILRNCDRVAYDMGLSEEEDRVKAEKVEELNDELEDLKRELNDLKEELEEFKNEN